VDEALVEKPPSHAPADASAFDREHLRLLTDKLVAKANELEAAGRRLSALTELNLQLTCERDPHALLDQVCRGARELLGAEKAILAVRGETAEEPVTWTTSGLSEEELVWLGQPAIEAGVAGRVLADRTPHRFSNPGGNPLAAGLCGDYPPVHCGLIVPILSTARSHGWFLLIDKPTHRASPTRMSGCFRSWRRRRAASTRTAACISR